MLFNFNLIFDSVYYILLLHSRIVFSMDPQGNGSQDLFEQHNPHDASSVQYELRERVSIIVQKFQSIVFIKFEV